MSHVYRGIVLSAIVLGSVVLKAQSHTDETPVPILNKTAQVARATHSLNADVVLTWQSHGEPPKKMTGAVTLLKPNYALLKLEGEYPVRVLASDGASLFTFRDETNYTEAPIDARGENIDTPWWGMPFRYFFTQSVNPFGPKPDPTAKLSYLGKERTGGQTFDVVSVHGTQPMVYTARLYINTTSVLQRTIIDFGTGTSPTATFSAELRNIKVNVPMRADAFRFTPPANAKLNQESLTDKMLAIGEGAPDFTLFSTDGTEVSLRAARKGMKATLVNFWFLACPPCRVEFPEFEKLYQEFHAQGFNIVAVDKADSSKAVADYARETGLTFPILLGGDDRGESVFEQYRVSAFPSTYLLDAGGRVVYRTVGTDVEELRRELKEMGLD